MLSLLRKSRLLQVLLILMIISVGGAVVYMFSSTTGFSSFSLIVLSAAMMLLTARLVQLEWRMLTSSKSGASRKVVFDEKLDALALLLRSEFAECAAQQGGGTIVSQRELVTEPGSGDASSLVIGRNAASVPESSERQSVLNGLLYPGGSSKARERLTGIFSPELKTILDGRYDVVELSPSTATQQSSHGGGIFVIDERSFEHGPWFGADTAGGTVLHSALTTAISLAVDRGGSVWFVSTGTVPKPYTSTYRSMSTGILGVNSGDANWGESMKVEFVELVEDYVMGLKK